MKCVVNIAQKVHNFVVELMAKSWVVENLLIAKYNETDEDGNVVQVDCIYCTIIRVSIIFFLLGACVGNLLRI